MWNIGYELWSEVVAFHIQHHNMRKASGKLVKTVGEKKSVLLPAGMRFIIFSNDPAQRTFLTAGWEEGLSIESPGALEGNPQKGSQIGSFLLETLQAVVLAVVLYFLIDTVIARVYVLNLSMVPTVTPGEQLIVNKMIFRTGNYQRGDIIVFHYPQDPREDYIKRLIGLPGDVVKAENGAISVNGQVLNEPYCSSPVSYTGEWLVPEDAFFVLGDNRNLSSDSHSWGFAPVENVVGKALAVYWPLAEIKPLQHADLVQAAN